MVRLGLSPDCAECIDTCAGVMGSRQKKTLIGYFFGLPGEGGKILRQNVLLIGTVTIAFFVFSLYLLFMRVPLDMTILPNHSFQPRISDNGSVINSYILSVKNRGRSDAKLKIEATGINGIIKIIPERILYVRAGDIRKFPLYVSVKNIGREALKHTINIRLKSPETDKLEVAGKTNFIIPEG